MAKANGYTSPHARPVDAAHRRVRLRPANKSNGKVLASNSAPRSCARCVPDRRANHGQPRSLADKSQHGSPALSQVTACVVAAFQAGHEGSIPFARSNPSFRSSGHVDHAAPSACAHTTSRTRATRPLPTARMLRGSHRLRSRRYAEPNRTGAGPFIVGGTRRSLRCWRCPGRRQGHDSAAEYSCRRACRLSCQAETGAR